MEAAPASARQQAAFRMSATSLPVWHCTPKLGSITVGWGSGDEHFEGAGGLIAGAHVIGLNRHKNKNGTVGGRARNWSKKQIAAAHLIALCPDIHADVNLSQMTEAINVRLASDPQQPNNYRVDRDTVREALKMLREKNPR
jgi:hypothetical protein